MSSLEVTAPNYGRSVPIRFERTLGRDYFRLRNWLAIQVIKASGIKKRHSRDQILDAVDWILANFIDAQRRSSKCFVGVPLSTAAFTKSRYFNRDFGHTNFSRVIDSLKTANPAYVTYKTGFNDRNTKVSFVSRIMPTEHLLRILRGYTHLVVNGNLPREKWKGMDQLIEDILASSDNLAPPFHSSSTVHRDTSDLIRLKDSEKHLISFVDTPQTVRMREELEKWNAFLTQNHHVDLLLSDDDLENIYEDKDEDLNAFQHDERDRPRFVEFERVRLYRVFNNGSFDEGGRFYGGWWQQIPKKFRKFLTINERPTCEHDYSGLHPHMLYAKEGLSLRDDAYKIDGIYGEEHRDLIKTTFLKLINAQKDQRIDRPRESALPLGWTWDALQQAIIKKHAPIAKYFRSGVGLKLQARDSEIAKTVMMRMMEKDVLVLPIHDSFITYHGRQDIESEMRRAYQEHVGRDIRIKADEPLVDWFIRELEGFELSSEEVVDSHQSRPGYDGFQERHAQFFWKRSDEWHYRFGDRPRPQFA